MQKEYIVSLNKGVDYDQFWNEIESSSDGIEHIPDRPVEIVNNRDGSLRSCHYALTDEEANELRNDSRVYSVEIPPSQRTDIKIGLRARQTGTFTKDSSVSGELANWGMIRSNYITNVFSTNDTANLDYLYTLTGEGVDVVIQDSGIQPDHPEFFDDNGISRVQLINWFTASGITGTQSPNHYRDYDGHGTHVAGTIAGKTFGWAKNARIYAQKLSGLEGAGDSGTGIDVLLAFDCIKQWHQNKPVDPTTGIRRPTVVNMSWGYQAFYNTVTGITYRGTALDPLNVNFDNAIQRWSYGLVPIQSNGTFITNTRIGSVDVDIQEMIDAGIHVVIAAGNNYHKIDISGGLDFNNSVTTNNGTINYHRGSSPLDDEAINVGNIDSEVFSEILDQAAESSEKGPGVDIWAAGTNIISATSNFVDTGRFSSSDYTDYYLDNNFQQMKISGTSMAAPQVAGVVALLCEMNPGARPVQIKNFLITNSTTSLYTTNLNNDYTNFRSLMGGSQRILYNKFNKEIASRRTGALIQR